MKYNCKNMTIPEIYTKTSLQKKYLANCKNSRKFHYIKLQNVQTASPALDTFVSSCLILQEIAVS